MEREGLAAASHDAQAKAQLRLMTREKARAVRQVQRQLATRTAELSMERLKDNPAARGRSKGRPIQGEPPGAYIDQVEPPGRKGVAGPAATGGQHEPSERGGADSDDSYGQSDEFEFEDEDTPPGHSTPARLVEQITPQHALPLSVLTQRIEVAKAELSELESQRRAREVERRTVLRAEAVQVSEISTLMQSSPYILYAECVIHVGVVACGAVREASRAGRGEGRKEGHREGGGDEARARAGCLEEHRRGGDPEAHAGTRPWQSWSEQRQRSVRGCLQPINLPCKVHSGYA